MSFCCCYTDTAPPPTPYFFLNRSTQRTDFFFFLHFFLYCNTKVQTTEQLEQLYIMKCCVNNFTVCVYMHSCMHMWRKINIISFFASFLCGRFDRLEVFCEGSQDSGKWWKNCSTYVLCPIEMHFSQKNTEYHSMILQV